MIIQMNGQCTEIRNPERPKLKPRVFTFDYSYWSHDGFTERRDGYLEPETTTFADQVSTGWCITSGLAIDAM